MWHSNSELKAKCVCQSGSKVNYLLVWLEWLLRSHFACKRYVRGHAFPLKNVCEWASPCACVKNYCVGPVDCPWLTDCQALKEGLEPLHLELVISNHSTVGLEPILLQILKGNNRENKTGLVPVFTHACGLSDRPQSFHLVSFYWSVLIIAGPPL